MANQPKPRSLGEHLHEELGGELEGDVTFPLDGCYDVVIRGMPVSIDRKRLNESITQFYEQIGFTRDTKTTLKDPVFYRGSNRNQNVRCMVISDGRFNSGAFGEDRVRISVAPLYSTNSEPSQTPNP